MPSSIRNIVLIAVILMSVAFFRISMLGESLFKLIEFASLGIIIAFFVIHIIYDQQIRFDKEFKHPIIFIFFGVVLSMFMAFWGHGQGVTTTAIAQRSMYFYLFYFFLHFMRIKFEDLEKIVFMFGLLYAALFILQYFAYPNELFDIRISVERGTIRIFLPGLSFMTLSYFLSLNKILNHHKYHHLTFIVLFLIVYVLFGTRQILGTILLVTILNIIFSGTVQSKVTLTILAIFAFFPIFLIFQDIFLQMLNLSQQQAGNFSDDVRIRAATYFLTTFFPNDFSYITGNGAHSLDSSFGVYVEGLKETKGFYQSDIGLIGDYTKYGIFFVLGVLWILFNVFTKRYNKDAAFVKFFYVTLLITLPTSGQEFTAPSSIIPNLIGLYLIDISAFQYKQDLIETNEV